jgi:hypothetical protein
LSGSDDEWLSKVAQIDPRSYRIGIGGDPLDDDGWLPLIERGRDGRWWGGRFMGSMTVEGRRIVIRPRLGLETVEAWVDQAFGLVAPPASARHDETETFIALLLARLWCRAVDNATRHGLPLLGVTAHLITPRRGHSSLLNALSQSDWQEQPNGAPSVSARSCCTCAQPSAPGRNFRRRSNSRASATRPSPCRLSKRRCCRTGSHQSSLQRDGPIRDSRGHPCRRR